MVSLSTPTLHVVMRGQIYLMHRSIVCVSCAEDHVQRATLALVSHVGLAGSPSPLLAFIRLPIKFLASKTIPSRIIGRARMTVVLSDHVDLVFLIINLALDFTVMLYSILCSLAWTITLMY